MSGALVLLRKARSLWLGRRGFWYRTPTAHCHGCHKNPHQRDRPPRRGEPNGQASARSTPSDVPPDEFTGALGGLRARQCRPLALGGDAGVCGPADRRPDRSCSVRLDGGHRDGIRRQKGPLGGITVRAYRENGERAGSATTKANGEYVIERLATAIYKVEFSGAGFETQWYLEKSSFARADPVVVMEPVGKPGIDARLKAEPAKGPVNTAPPVLSGTPVLGQTLSCSSGSWTGTPPPAFTYVWLREGNVIGGATGHTYVVQAADEGRDLVCQVTATNSVSRASVISNALKVPAAKPPAPPPPPSPPPSPPPPLTTITGVSQSNSRWREGNRLAAYSRAKRPPVGTTFRLVLNQRSTVSFASRSRWAGARSTGSALLKRRQTDASRGANARSPRGLLPSPVGAG
jgi:Carboxypeptidase regulatory-like domain